MERSGRPPNLILRYSPRSRQGGGGVHWRLTMLCRVCACLMAAYVNAASDAQPHFHSGKLTPYKIGEPSLLLSGRDEAQLRAGRPVMQALVADDGETRRLIMVQDIAAPSSVVLG